MSKPKNKQLQLKIETNKRRREKQKLEKHLQEYRRYNNEHMYDDVVYEGGFSNFFFAIQLDRIDILEEHFKRGERPLNENIDFHPFLNIIKPLLLIQAIQAKSYCVVRYLLEKGASVDAFCKVTQMTPYQYAEKNSLKTLKIFNDFKNEIKTKIAKKYPHIKEINQSLILQEEIKHKHEPFEYKKGLLNYVSAISVDCVEVVEKHIKTDYTDLDKAYVYPMPPGFRQHIPLMMAIKSQSYNVLKYLLEQGANPDVLDLNILMSPRQYAKENDKKAYQIICEFEK